MSTKVEFKGSVTSEAKDGVTSEFKGDVTMEVSDEEIDLSVCDDEGKVIFTFKTVGKTVTEIGAY